MNRPSYSKTLDRSMEERPDEVDERKVQGHWEMDLMVGKRGSCKEVLLTMSERKVRKGVLRKLPDKTQESVIHALDVMERRLGRIKFREKFKSITVDNESWFLNSNLIERSCFCKNKKRTTVHYAHLFSAKEIKRIDKWLNNYPGKIMEYRTPYEVYIEIA